MHFRGGVQHRDIARGAFWNSLGYVVGGLVAIAWPVLLVYWLGRAGYGLVSYLALWANQSYLFNLGLGEAVGQRLTAAYSIGRPQEAYPVIRAGLLGVWVSSVGLSIAWLSFGPQTLASWLKLSPAEASLLTEVHIWVPLAFWGTQTGMYLGWIPVALRRFRWAAFNTLLQSLWQAIIPLLLLTLSPTKTPRLALETTLIGYVGYGFTVWGLTGHFLRWLPLPGQPRLLPHLLRQSLWIAANNLLGLPITFVERTLIGRWASLNAMGFYSAVHYIFSKAVALTSKGIETLFPVFGSVVDSPRRQMLRLSQATWLMLCTALLSGFIGAATLSFVWPLLPIQIGTLERRTLAGLLGTWLFFLPSMPLLTFFTSQGRTKVTFFLNLTLSVVQLSLTVFLVQKGYFFWASVGGLWTILGQSSWLFRRFGLSGRFWKYWGLPTLGRAALCWLLGAGVFLYWPSPAISGSAFVGIAALFMAGELAGQKNARKRILLKQLRDTFVGLAEAARSRFLRPTRQRTLDNR